MPQQGRYRAFISYSHADEAWATWLHRALETWRVPSRLVGRDSPLGPIPRRLHPVFRDREELASAPELGSEIQRALADSATLIVICSPNAAASHWVNEEIRHYKALGRADPVLCLIVDGEPGDPDRECFPEALRHQVDADGRLLEAPAEPIAADARAGHDRRRNALLKLIAGMLGLGLDELRQRDHQRRQRFMAAVATASLLLAAGASTLAWIATSARDEARAQRELAQARQQQAEGLIQFMLGDLREKLEPIGKLEVLDAVGDQAMRYFGHVDAGALSDRELQAHAQALRQVGAVRVQQGALREAAPAFRKAHELDLEILTREPGNLDAIYNLAQSQFYLGYDLYLRGEHQAALRWMEKYADSADSLVRYQPMEAKWHLERVYARHNLATLANARGDGASAERAFLEVLEGYEAIVELTGNADEHAPERAVALGWLAVNAQDQRDWRSAASYAARQLAVLDRALARDPGDARLQAQRARALVNQSKALFALQEEPALTRSLESLRREADALVQLDPANAEYRFVKLSSALLSADHDFARGYAARALASLDRAAAANDDRGSGDDPPAYLEVARFQLLLRRAMYLHLLGRDADAFAQLDRITQADSQTQQLQTIRSRARMLAAAISAPAASNAPMLDEWSVDDASPLFRFIGHWLRGEHSAATALIPEMSHAERRDVFLKAFCERLGCEAQLAQPADQTTGAS